ncbi:hypothetical protein [Dinghuibacter silviterrae]|uniref:DUF2383 domain-containing protein n=1 Tax=Dinghuibacter silviterrae TaxID=1539049 RepID=A0A4R8DWR4_9BACT|nr:hypothetical protein [Dinghuibacter silviterrae]TDX02378.1 hypothetical protein EDB95_3436 [Dinghuibacter silviterrae]
MSSTANTQITAILESLIRTNDQRIRWYEKAITQLKPEDRDLVGVFESNLRRSQEHNEFLNEEIKDLDDESLVQQALREERPEGSPKFTGQNRHAVLMNCEVSETATQLAYQKALNNPQLPGYIKELLGEQREELEKMRRRIMALKTTAL